MTKLATAAPKPRKKAKKARTPLQRSRTPIARGPVKRKNAKRKASEFARTYHSRARVEFIQSLPCIVGTHGACIGGPSENAHVIDDGTKGASRKSGFACIASDRGPSSPTTAWISRTQHPRRKSSGSLTRPPDKRNHR